MEHDDPFRPDEPASSAQSSAFQIISIVLGGLSIPCSLILGFGIVPGLLGLAFGVLAGRRVNWTSGMAAIGIAFSLLGIVMSLAIIGLAVWAFRASTQLSEDMAASQFQVAQAWQGVVAPDAAIALPDGTTYSFRDRAERKLVLYQFFPVAVPMFSDGSGGIDSVNRLAEAAGTDFDVVAIAPMPPDVTQTSIRNSGGAAVTAPLASSELLPAPFLSVGFVNCYYVIDRNGVVQHVFAADTPYETILEAALGPDFEGKPATEPDLTGIDTTYTFTSVRSGGILP